MIRFYIIFLIIIITVSLRIDTAEARSFKILGNDTCLQCHKEIYDSWSKSAHAKVFDLLKPGVRPKMKIEAGLKPDIDYSNDESCMKCHVIGWGKGGYSFENPDDKWKGIGCEVCHGAAEKWLALHDKKGLKRRDRKLKQNGMKKPFKGKTVCARCHYSNNTPYNYRNPERSRNWRDPELAKTYHFLKR